MSYGGVGALPAARLPPLRSGDSGERPEGPARRRSPPGTRRAGVALGARQEPPQTPPVLGGSGEEGARQNTGGTQNEGRAQPGARRSLQFKMTALRCGRSCSGSLPGVELLCSVQLPVSLHSCSQEQVTAVGPASFSE